MSPLDTHYRRDFQIAYAHFGEQGRRLIGFALRRFTAPANSAFDADAIMYLTSADGGGLAFLGMSAIMDPPRDDAASAIHDCKRAGISVFMVTGDHPVTATAIARQIGLIGGGAPVAGQTAPDNVSLSQVVSPGGTGRFRRHAITITRSINRWGSVANVAEEDPLEVITGDHLQYLSDADWTAVIAKKYVVFARTTPEHKLFIVEQCRKRGEIVSVTGDGVNDAPALKRANVGISMGIVGSDVAKQAADIVLMDDSFSSIVAGIGEGGSSSVTRHPLLLQAASCSTTSRRQSRTR